MTSQRLLLPAYLGMLVFTLISPFPAAAGEAGSAAPPAATEERIIPPSGHHEVLGQPYVAAPPEGRATSPAYRRGREGFFTTQVNVNASGQNIVGDAANEPSIAVDPTNPLRMVIAWRQFNSISSDFRQAGNAHTTDGGQGWTFPGVVEPGVFRSDPVLDTDSAGTAYFCSLKEDFTCDVFRSTDGGATWDGGTPSWGGDKQWMVIDKTGGPGDGNIYSFWTSYYSSCYPGFFTRSATGGDSYESCRTVPGDPYWGTMAVGPDGELYVSGDGFIVARSADAWDAGQSVSFDFSTAVDLDGYLGYGGINPDGLTGQAWIAVDHSSGPTRGNVYLLASVSRFGTSDPLDVMFARSTDGGENWSAPLRVNDDPGDSAWQWFAALAVAPDGRLDAVWFDSRNDPGGYDSQLFYACSTDAGETWSANEQLTEAFDPRVGFPQQSKIGDYIGVVSNSTGVHIAYPATFNGEEDVYYGHIPYGSPALPRLVTGPGPVQVNPTLVRTWDPAAPSSFLAEWPAYGVAQYGANVAAADLGGDGLSEVITGPGPGAVFGPHVRAFSGTGTQVPGVNFLAYGTHKYGVNVAAGDLDGDGMAEIVTGAGPGAVFGPHVRGWNVDGATAAPLPGVSFLAYGTHKWGVNVACGDLDGDGTDEIVTGAGPGAVFGPHVRGWNVDGAAAAAIPAVSFLAYGTHKYGVNVACGDLDGDGFAEIVTGPGPGGMFGAQVRGWDYDGTTVSALPGVNFTAYSPAQYGAAVATLDLDSDGMDEILTLPGPDSSWPAQVRAWNVDGGTATSITTIDFDAYQELGLLHGGRIAGGRF